ARFGNAVCDIQLVQRWQRMHMGRSESVDSYIQRFNDLLFEAPKSDKEACILFFTGLHTATLGGSLVHLSTIGDLAELQRQAQVMEQTNQTLARGGWSFEAAAHLSSGRTTPTNNSTPTRSIRSQPPSQQQQQQSQAPQGRTSHTQP